MESYRTVDQVKPEFVKAPRKALILTTVSHESRAVNAHLSEREKIAGHNGAIYYKGRYAEPAGDWQVIHVICQPGNSDASSVATKAHYEFGKFDVQMFVGVAGSLKDDILPGSVVAGNFVYNAHSGKTTDDGYYARPHDYPAAPELVNAAQVLILEGDWVTYVRDPLPTKLPSVELYPCPYPPDAFLKGIASGEQVVAGGNTPIYKLIREHLNDAGAVEMEGYGAMSAAFQCKTSAIIVRGISDMCAGKNEKADATLQPIASAHAAAFAFAILSVLSKASPSDSESLPAVTSQLEEPSPYAGRIDFVLNLRGEPEDWPISDIEQIIKELQSITGDPDVTLVRIDRGSVRLVVSVRETDVERLSLETLKSVARGREALMLGAGAFDDLDGSDWAGHALKDAARSHYQLDPLSPDLLWLDRPEKQQLENRFQSISSSTVLLGPPGSGKSALLATIAAERIDAGDAVLAIKSDLVSTEVRDEEGLMRNLQLPDLPSRLIEQAAEFQPVYVVIDQLDALATFLDLKSDRLNVLLNLVRRVGGLPNVHVLLSSRTFEFNHDVRLRSIAADPVTLTLPPWHEVRQALVDEGVDPDAWPESAREAIRSPQALKTYLSIDSGDDVTHFSKYQSMLEELWRQKIGNAQDGTALASLATDIAGAMAEEETLWLAASRFDDRALLLDRLESTGLIARSKTRTSIAFSHQTVLDFVLARSFVRSSGRLSSYVLERQNSLFVRGKLWSALQYLRDAELTAYEREFQAIWTCGDLRRHLRLLLIEFLGEVASPAPFEIVALEQAIESHDFHVAALRSCIGNPDWFIEFADGPVTRAMLGNETDAQLALWILERAWTVSSETVTKLLEKYWLPDAEKDTFCWLAVDACGSWNSDVEKIARTVLLRTPIGISQVDYTSSTLGVESPEVALRLIRSKLDYLLAAARRAPAGKAYPADGSAPELVSWLITDDPARHFEAVLESSEWQSVPALSEAHPKAYLQTLWPWYKETFEAIQATLTRERHARGYPGFYSVRLDLDSSSRPLAGREASLLTGLRLALEGVAQSEPEFFSTWQDENCGIEFAPVQRLIAHGLAASPARFAERALNWLLQDHRRLHLGSHNDLMGTTLGLVRAVSPHWTPAQRSAFETAVFSYSEQAPEGLDNAVSLRSFQRALRATREQLLEAIPEALRSDKANHLVLTEKRALGAYLERIDPSSQMMHIGPPMTAEAMSKAKDSDILKIFREVPDNTHWDHPTDWMRGGNIQLSRAFADFAKKEPARAVGMFAQFAPGLQERAAGYALDSMAEDEQNDRLVQEAFLTLFDRDFSSQEFRSSSSHGIEKIANRDGRVDPVIVLSLVSWLRATPPIETDVSADDAVASEEPGIHAGDRASQPASLLWGLGGMSVLPDGNFPILSALTAILLRDGEEGRNRLMAILTDHLAREPNKKVWQALLVRLSHAGGRTPTVVSDFVRALFARYPSLLETHEAVYFLAYAQRWDSALVVGVIANWDETGSAAQRQALGELVGLVSITNGSDETRTLRATLVRQGSAEAKTGLAFAGANLWYEPKFHIEAAELLRQLVPGADRSRTFAILDVFRMSNELRPEPLTLGFLKDLLDPSFDLAAAPLTFFVENLQTLLPHAATLVGSLALKIVRTWQGALADIRGGASLAAPQLTDLALTLHRLGGEPREIGVAVFEALLDINAYGARDTLKEIDGRFGSRPIAPRRRLIRAQKRLTNTRAN